ncbi:uncharacterized protein DUF4214 [Janthinobacterium sp. 61]|uniref:DUF4214 domain-containing protein n=1 Tax=Janthinobacterium sp. 61 TaxID=2035209 RepID=UPI000C707231|nr:DUF4214 domain-containing protein [Janthinobacterium sp. 61]PKV45688.1 uncharacterized protein DUF4214 [Janthinobacterium sp. 61]
MATYTDAIQKLYVAYFNRPADAAGLAYWEGVVTAANGSTAAVSAAFAASTEYQTEYAQVNTSGVISQIYANLFGHAPDAPGLAYWVKAVGDKVFTIDQAVTKIAAGAQGTDKVAYDSKVLVATSFTAALDTDAEKAGYNGADANKAAKDFLATIKTAEDATAAIVPAALDAKVAAVVKAGVPFTVPGALTALTNAGEALATFLAAADGDNNAKTSLTEAQVKALETTADTGPGGVGSIVGGVYNAPGQTAGVKAAALADKIDSNAKALADAQKAITTANTAVAKDAVLATYVAKAEVTAAADTAAHKATVAAQASLAGVVASYIVNNSAITVNADGTVATLIKVDADSKKLVLETGVTETTNPGITAVLNASIAKEAADKAEGTTNKAALAAQADVNRSDFDANVSGTKLVDVGAAMTIVKIVAGEYPTAAQINAEILGLAAAKVAADAVVTAAGAAVTPAQTQAAADAATAVTAFNTKLAAFDTADTVNPLADALAGAKADAADVVADIKALTEAVAKLDAAHAVVKEMDGLKAAIAAAEQNFADHGLAKPVTLTSFDVATSAADIFVAGDVNSTVVGLDDKDMLFVGSDYVLNAGKPAAGNNAVLEIFLAQSGANTVVTVEKAAYGSESGDTITITLVGVNATDVHFANGIVTV